MEILYKKNMSLRFIAILLSVLLLFSSVANTKKVYADSLLNKASSIAMISVILTALLAQGAISSEYKVTAPDLSSITEKAQANLQAAGSAAIDQANKLGEAIKSGAESAKIKALASGAVIYAFLSAVQDTLFQKSDFQFAEEHTDSTRTVVGVAGSYMVVQNISSNYANYHSYFGDITPSVSWNRLYDRYFRTADLSVNKDHMTLDFSYIGDLYYVNKTTGVALPFTTNVSASSEFIYISYDSQTKLYLEAFLFGNTILSSSASEIASAPSVTMPTVLPQTIINNINNWDGTSDLVLAPPLPYDIPDDEALVIDPGYIGPDVIDPTDPVDPPAEEGTIVLPWLAALLGLLGLGNPSLEGIEAGVKTAIDKLIEGITATAQDVFDGSKEIFGNITDALTGIDAGIQSGIDALTGSISVPLTNIADFALSVPDFFAIPEGKSIATPIIEQIPTVFPIVDQMNTALNKITVQTRPLIIYYPYLDGTTKEINLNWYEPAREQVKHGVGLLFKVVTALACFAMISNVFGIGIRVGAGQAYTDNNSGGSNGGNSRKKGD